MSENLNIVISSGETHGHLNLAVALIEYIRDRIKHPRIVFVGIDGRVQMDKVLPDDIKKYALSIVPVYRKSRYKNVKLPFLFLVSC